MFTFFKRSIHFFFLQTFCFSFFLSKTCFDDCEWRDASVETEVSTRSVRWKAEKKHDGMGNNVWRTENVNERLNYNECLPMRALSGRFFRVFRAVSCVQTSSQIALLLPKTMKKQEQYLCIMFGCLLHAWVDVGDLLASAGSLRFCNQKNHVTYDLFFDKTLLNTQQIDVSIWTWTFTTSTKLNFFLSTSTINCWITESAKTKKEKITSCNWKQITARNLRHMCALPTIIDVETFLSAVHSSWDYCKYLH